MNLRSILAGPSGPQHSAYDYKMLVLILVLLAWYIPSYFSLPPGYDGARFSMGVLILMLLFHHLDHAARVFKWRTWLGVALHVLSWAWIVFGLFYFNLLLVARLLGMVKRTMP